MAKVISPLFNAISGKIKNLNFRTRKNKTIELSMKRIPFNPRSPAQLTQRDKYGKCVEKWKKLTEEEKQQYAETAKRLNLSLYHAFMLDCLSKKEIWYEITIDNTQNSNDLTDYQILLEITEDVQFFTDCKGDQTFLEFYDEDKATLLNHYVELWDTTNHNARIWIKIPQIPANSTKKIYLKINTERTEDLSNGEAVFDFFDDFEALDTAKWTDYSEAGTEISVSNGVLTIDNGADEIDGKLTVTEKTFSENIVIISKARLVTYYVDNTNWFGMMALGDTPDAWVGSTGSGYNVIIRANRNGQMLKDGSVKVGDTALDVDTAQWHKYAFVVSGNGVKLLVDDIEKLTYSESISRTGYVGLRTFGVKAEFDYIIIRKFTDPEPTVSYAKIT